MEGNITARLTTGNGTDDFEIKVEIDTGSTYYSETIGYTPDEAAAEHNNFTISSYLDYLSSPAIGGNIRFRLLVRNTGDDTWEVQDCVLFITKF